MVQLSKQVSILPTHMSFSPLKKPSHPQIFKTNLTARREKYRSDFTLWERFFYGGVFTLTAALVCFGLSSLAYTGRLRILFPKNNLVLTTFSEKMEFAARYWFIALFWLYLTTHIVVFRRFICKAINPLSGNENLVEESVKINTNSTEQFIQNVMAQICVLANLEGDKVIRVIPMMNVFFLLGRICFWFGYPKYRAFGMTMTMFPASLAIYFCMHNFATNFVDHRIFLFK